MAVRGGAIVRYAAYAALIAGIAAAAVFWSQGGVVRWPEPDAIAEFLARGSSAGATTLQAAAVVAIAAFVLCAALAPLIYAIRSEDGMTIIVSLVLMIATWAIVFSSRTMLDMTLAAVIYLANICLSGAVYIAHTLRRAIRSEDIYQAPRPQEPRFS